MSVKYSGSSVLTKIFNLIKSKFDGLATVATSGSYNDLTDTPDTADIVRATASVSANNTTTISIPITITDTSKLTVYQNGLLLTPTVHYTATTSAITLVGYTANSGDIFTFVGANVSGTSLDVSAASVLFSDTTDCYGNCTTVEQALAHIAQEWQPKITEIKVNGTKVNPSEGVVDISVPTLKTISVNGTNISIDTNGNASISGIVKSLSINGTTYSPDTSGKLSLTNIMKNNVAQTMQAKLVAQNNTSYTTKQVRNITFSTAEPTSSDGDNGDIWLVYEA